MVEVNPFATTSGHDAHFVADAEQRTTRGLRRCRIAVLLLGVIVSLAAIGKAMLAISLMAAPAPEAIPNLLGEPLIPPDVSEAQRMGAITQIVYVIGSGVALGLFACILFNFAVRLSQCASGRIPLKETLVAQNACWYTAASLAIAYGASNIWVW